MWLPGAPCFHAWLWEQSVLPAFQNILGFWNLEDCTWMESTIASVYDPPVSSGVVGHRAYFHGDQRCVLVLGRSVLPSRHENPLSMQRLDPVTGYGKTLVLDATPWFEGRCLQSSSVCVQFQNKKLSAAACSGLFCSCLHSASWVGKVFFSPRKS